MSRPKNLHSSSNAEGSGASEKEASEESPSQFVLLAVVFEGALAVIGLAAGTWSGLAWEPMIQSSGASLLLGVLGGIGLFGLHLLLLFPGGNRNPFYRHIYKPLRHVLGDRLPDVGLGSLVLVSIASGVGEEVLFRGWLQTETNIVVASVLFGVAHIWGKEGIPYGLYAIGMGFVLGGLFEYTGQTLWAPVLAHAVNNLLGFLALKHEWFPGSIAYFVLRISKRQPQIRNTEYASHPRPTATPAKECPKGQEPVAARGVKTTPACQSPAGHLSSPQ